jgi:hypothetical protein
MFNLVLTHSAYTERYDVYHRGALVRSLRLDHGYFRAEYRGLTADTADTDGYVAFTQAERPEHLRIACAAIPSALVTDGTVRGQYEADPPAAASYGPPADAGPARSPCSGVIPRRGRAGASAAPAATGCGAGTSWVQCARGLCSARGHIGW